MEDSATPVDAIRLSLEGNGIWILNVVIGLIMFGIALDMRLGDFTRIARSPKGPLIGMVAQFLLLPAFTYLLTRILNPIPSIALGMILVAACPGGNVSNFLTYLAKGNTALSVTMTALSTSAALFFTPLNLAFWGSLNPQTRAILQEIHLDPLSIGWTILLILGIPTLLGMTCAAVLPWLAQRLHTPFKVGSIVVFVSLVGIVLAKDFDIFLQYVGWVALAVFLHNALGLSIGYVAARVGGLPERDRRAVSIEVGIQNSALGLALIFDYFHGLGGMALVAGWWGIWHIISGLTIATFWSRRPPSANKGELPA